MLHVNTLIDLIELDQNEISFGSKGVVYSFSNMIEHACEHSIRLKTERTAHVQRCRNVKWSRTTSHQSLFWIIIIKQLVLGAGRGIFLVCMYIYPEMEKY